MQAKLKGLRTDVFELRNANETLQSSIDGGDGSGLGGPVDGSGGGDAASLEEVMSHRLSP